MNIERLLSDDVGRRSAFQRYVKQDSSPAVVWPAWLENTNFVSRPLAEWSSPSATATTPDHRRTSHSTPLRNARRRPRTTFSAEQTDSLEKEYGKNEYISRSKRMRIADQLRLNEGQIKIWFQNRRAKDKRIQKAHSKIRSYHLSCLSNSPTISIVHPDQNGDNTTDHSDDEKSLPPDDDQYEERSNAEVQEEDSESR